MSVLIQMNIVSIKGSLKVYLTENIYDTCQKQPKKIKLTDSDNIMFFWLLTLLENFPEAMLNVKFDYLLLNLIV